MFSMLLCGGSEPGWKQACPWCAAKRISVVSHLFRFIIHLQATRWNTLPVLPAGTARNREETAVVIHKNGDAITADQRVFSLQRCYAVVVQDFVSWWRQSYSTKQNCTRSR